MSVDKQKLQDDLYEFPYHYLPILEAGGAVRLHRQLSWGFEYLTYMSFVASVIREHSPQSLLDVGCGDGRLVYMLKNAVPSIVGLDLSERAIAFARAFNPEVEFICGDVSTLSRKFSFATLVEVLEHIPDNDVSKFIQSVGEHIEDNGLLLISVPSINMPLNKKHYRHYTLDLLRQSIPTNFVIRQHWWLYRRSSLARILGFTLCNRLFTTNWRVIRRVAWFIHQKSTYMADASTGAHLICLTQLR